MKNCLKISDLFSSVIIYFHDCRLIGDINQREVSFIFDILSVVPFFVSVFNQSRLDLNFLRGFKENGISLIYQVFIYALLSHFIWTAGVDALKWMQTPIRTMLTYESVSVSFLCHFHLKAMEMEWFLKKMSTQGLYSFQRVDLVEFNNDRPSKLARIGKMARHNNSLRLVAITLKEWFFGPKLDKPGLIWVDFIILRKRSIQQLFFMITILVIFSFLVASLTYFAEFGVNPKFNSIPGNNLEQDSSNSKI